MGSFREMIICFQRKISMFHFFRFFNCILINAPFDATKYTLKAVIEDTHKAFNHFDWKRWTFWFFFFALFSSIKICFLFDYLINLSLYIFHVFMKEMIQLAVQCVVSDKFVTSISSLFIFRIEDLIDKQNQNQWN